MEGLSKTTKNLSCPVFGPRFEIGTLEYKAGVLINRHQPLIAFNTNQSL
jgi:hypothetical protein